jgi:lipopolysaccharide export system permease protein
VALTFLFLFFDFIQELSGRSAIKSNLTFIMVTVFLKVPDRLYELLPLAVLIGALITFSSFSQASEYAVIRASGGSARSFLVILGLNGMVFAILAFLIGEFLAPEANRIAGDLKVSQSENKIALKNFRSGYWIKDGNGFVNIRSVDSPSLLNNVSIVFVDGGSRVVSRISAGSAVYEGDSGWILKNVTEYIFSSDRIVTKRKITGCLKKSNVVLSTYSQCRVSEGYRTKLQCRRVCFVGKDCAPPYRSSFGATWFCGC